ncbi:MAG: type II toxin-antitoxin system HicA family toxin [Firmicutes bacterium]|nr:type II toxin-antitoxin system HicA family toxin [Bacillota bacterium]
MSRILSVDARTMERVLLKLGFRPERQRGSHVRYLCDHDATCAGQWSGAPAR